MAIVTPVRPRGGASQPAVRVRQRPRNRPSRDQRLADARAREVRARRELAQAFARMDRTYTLAAHDLSEFDVYLSGVCQRLRHAGYLVPADRRVQL